MSPHTHTKVPHSGRLTPGTAQHRARGITLALGASAAVLLLFLPTPTHAATIGKPANNLGLVGYWSFDEGTGTQAGDFSGNGNTGTLTNGPTWVDGKRGKALNFVRASNQHVVAPNIDTSNTSDITVSVWTKISSQTDNMRIVSLGYSTDDVFDIYYDVSANRGLSVAATDSLGSYHNITAEDVLTGYGGGSGLANIGEWHFMTMVVDSANITYYYDDKVRTEAWSGNPLATTTDNLLIAALNAASPGNKYDGTIDDVRIYNRALSASEVAKLYQAGSARINASRTAVSDGLVGWWTMDGGDTVSTIADKSGQGNNGYFIGGATSTAKTIGKLGQALSFDGSNDYVNVLNSPSISDYSSGVTSCLWFKTDSVAVAQSPYSQNIPADIYLNFWMNVGGSYTFLRFETDSAQNFTSITKIYPNVWYFACGLYDTSLGSNQAKLYINGSLDKEATKTFDATNTGPIFIGAFNNAATILFKFSGLIDDVRIYNRALSAAEIKQIYNEGAGTKVNTNTAAGSSLDDGLVGYWSFNGPDVTDKVYDRSGQGNNGYFIGGATSSAKTIGKLGQALTFDGVDDYITFSSIASDLTVGATWTWWSKRDSPSTVDTVFGSTSSSLTDFIAFLTTTSLKFDAHNPGDEKVFTLNSGDTGWHHYAIAVVGGTATGYQDGVELSSGALTSTTETINQLGARFTTRDYGGQLDDVRIYNRALSADEVTQLYLMGH